MTDAGQRFERGSGSALPPIALERATALLLEIAGGEPGPVQVTRAAAGGGDADGVGEAAAQPPRANCWERAFRTWRSARSCGDQRQRARRPSQGWRVQRPPHRFDIRIEEDLIEEVARLRGFDSIAESARHRPADRRVRDRVAACPTIGC